MAQININGVIGEEYTYSKFLVDYANTQEQPIRLLINSVGGDVMQGEQIAEFIKSHSDRFLTVSNSGDVASIAASIFLALEREKRYFDISKGVFLIHNPFADPMSMAIMGADTTANGLSVLSDELKSIESGIAKFIQAQTGADIDVIKGLMAVNEPLNEEQLTALNIATITKFRAVAYLQTKNKNEMTKEEMQELIQTNNIGMLDVMKAWFKKTTKFVAIMLTDATGAQIEFPDVPEGAEPIVGDMAKGADGAVLNGDIVMADGKTFTFENGTVTAITEAEIETEVEVETNPEMEALKAENEALKLELAAKAQAETELVAIKAQLSKFKSEMVSTKPNEKTADITDESPLMAAAREMKNKQNKN